MNGDFWHTTEKEYSEKVAAEIDEEVKKLLDTAHQRTTELITEKRPLVEALAKRLLEKEVVEREEFQMIVKELGTELAKT